MYDSDSVADVSDSDSVPDAIVIVSPRFNSQEEYQMGWLIEPEVDLENALLSDEFQRQNELPLPNIEDNSEYYFSAYVRHLEYINEKDQIVCQMTHTNICVKCRLYTNGEPERFRGRYRGPGNDIRKHLNCHMFAPRGGSAARDGPARGPRPVQHYVQQDHYDEIIFLNLTLCKRCKNEMHICFEQYHETQKAQGSWAGQYFRQQHHMMVFEERAVDAMCEITRTIFLNVFGYALGSPQDEERRTHLRGRRQRDLDSIAQEEQRMHTRRMQRGAELLEARAGEAAELLEAGSGAPPGGPAAALGALAGAPGGPGALGSHGGPGAPGGPARSFTVKPRHQNLDIPLDKYFVTKYRSDDRTSVLLQDHRDS